MSRLGDSTKRVLARMVADAGTQTFTWTNGAEVECVPTNQGNGTVLSIGGFEEVVTLALYVQKTTFLAADSTLITVDSTLYTADSDGIQPVAGRKITFRDAQLRIVVATVDPTDTFYMLQLTSVNR